MYKVLIVDDEGNIREGIKRNCRWEEYKISQVMTASNGLEALKIMEDFKPDIVFTDIKMPIINGLDFLRISSERYQNCLFVVLSGYDDFDFARSAMKYNAKEYILKPVSVNEIHDVLAKLVAQLEVQRQESLREEKYRLLVRMKESEAIRDYIIGKSDDVEMKLNDLELFRTERLRLLTFDLSNGTDDVRDACSLLETYFDARRLLFLCDVVDDTLLVCIQYYPYDFLKPELEEIMAQWKQTHASRLIAAVSECSDYAHIQQTYTNLRECIGARFFHDDSEIITTYDKPSQSRTPREGAFSGELMETAIRSGNFEEADRILNLLYNDLDDMSYSIKQIRAYATEAFLSIIRRTCPQNLPDFFDDAFRIMNGDSLSRIIQIFRESIHRVMEKGDARRDISKNPMVKRVEEIVEQEIGNEELSLNYIAKKYLFISSTYMGKLFTAEKGERFSHYVTEKRMKFAKELLVTQPHMRIQDVSVKVGYGYATQYFSRVFKQKTGYTPSEYREKFCFDSIENTEEKREEK